MTSCVDLAFVRRLGDIEPQQPVERDRPRVGLALECRSPAEVDDVYARAVEAGFDGEKAPWDAFWGQRYAQRRDPDGVPVDLYASL